MATSGVPTPSFQCFINLSISSIRFYPEYQYYSTVHLISFGRMNSNKKYSHIQMLSNDLFIFSRKKTYYYQFMAIIVETGCIVRNLAMVVLIHRQHMVRAWPNAVHRNSMAQLLTSFLAQTTPLTFVV